MSSAGMLAAAGAEKTERRLAEICSLLERAGAGAFRLEGGTCDGAAPIACGWSLAGGRDAGQRTAAAELAARLLRHEQEINSLSAEILERYEEATLIYRVSQRLATERRESSVARLVIEEAASTLRARAGELWLMDDETVVLAAVVTGDGRPAPCELREEGSMAVWKEGRPWLREAGPDSEAQIAVPLPGPDGSPLGVLVLRGRADGRSYRTGEIKLLTALACLAAAFIRNDRLAEQTRRAEARERQNEIARQIHRCLLPAEDAVLDGLEISGGCRAAEDIGGDYYGYMHMPDGSLGLAMADIAGHGVGAALYMAAAKGALQAEARRASSPAELLRRANQALAAEFARSDVFATALVLRFVSGGRQVDYSNGGHNPPLLIRACGSVELLDRGGPALGVLDNLVYDEGTKSLEEGDLLLVYTDGLIEARNPEGCFFTLERLTELAARNRHAHAQSIRQQVMDELLLHCAATPPQDDVTLVVVRAVSHSAPQGRS